MAKLPLETLISNQIELINRHCKDAEMDKRFDVEIEVRDKMVARGEDAKRIAQLIFSTTEFGKKMVLFSISYTFKDKADERNTTRWKSRLYNQFVFEAVVAFGQVLGQMKKLNMEREKEEKALLVDTEGKKIVS